jgi:hypothetical protein
MERDTHHVLESVTRWYRKMCHENLGALRRNRAVTRFPRFVLVIPSQEPTASESLAGIISKPPRSTIEPQGRLLVVARVDLDVKGASRHLLVVGLDKFGLRDEVHAGRMLLQGSLARIGETLRPRIFTINQVT